MRNLPPVYCSRTNTPVVGFGSHWDRVVVDRSKELMGWVNVCQRTVQRGVTTYVYVNNHYAGFAPATVEQFQKLWKTAT
jgi:uncharacterized protein YecE (DUF72 family)